MIDSGDSVSSLDIDGSKWLNEAIPNKGRGKRYEDDFKEAQGVQEEEIRTASLHDYRFQSQFVRKKHARTK